MQQTSFQIDTTSGTAKPFLKWAGGKTQLLNAIEKKIPSDLKDGRKYTYVEPFVGSGAMLFYMLKEYNNAITQAVINDINPVLILTYRTIKNRPDALIESLQQLSHEYFSHETHEERKQYFLERRIEFNELSQAIPRKAALMIFLNKTCFNGLYRVNSRGFFNVPFGKYKHPKILDEPNIRAVNELLQKVEILQGDYRETIQYINDKNVLFYFDPPYKPISHTSSFTSYARDSFHDDDQIRLKNFCDEVDALGYRFILSNSDLKNCNPDDEFFDELYKDYSISRVKAMRAINSKASGRGEINELLITNGDP